MLLRASCDFESNDAGILVNFLKLVAAASWMCFYAALDIHTHEEADDDTPGRIRLPIGMGTRNRRLHTTVGGRTFAAR